MEGLYGVPLDPAYAQHAHAALAAQGFTANHPTWQSPPPPQQPLPQTDTGLSHEDLAWLEQQLSLAATGSPSFAASPSTPQHPLPPSLPPAPQGPHAFPPVSSARFHPYQLPAERGQRARPPEAGLAPFNPLLPPHVQPQLHRQPLLQRPSLGNSTSSSGPLDWPSFGAVAPHFAPVPPPPQALPAPVPPPQRAQPTTLPSTILYPPHDAPSPILLRDAPSPTYPPAPHASPASYVSPSATSPARALSPTSPPRMRRRRARSAPIPVAALFPPPAAQPAIFAGAGLSEKDEKAQERAEKKQQQLESLFGWLDEQRWSFSHLFTALSDLDPGSEAEHRRRLEEFLQLDGPGVGDDRVKLLKEARRRWALKKGELGEEKGPDEVVRMWEDMGGLGRSRDMADAVRDLHSNIHDGAVPGVAIRNIINRYGEAYGESANDMKRLDAALSRPPSPHLTSAPREAAVWTGTLVLPATQADVLQSYLSAPGRPSPGAKGGIEPDHMRIYSSLSPLDLHARGAELCRTILLRDAQVMQKFGHHFDRLHAFTVGPIIAPIDACGFAHFDDASVFHHAVMIYLQLAVRYPQFKSGKEATVVILPDLPPPVHPTPLETLLIDRALHSHWEYLRLFLLEQHGGLLRSAVRAFSGVKLSKFDLLSVCDDTTAVIGALARNKKNPNDRILPYDCGISQIRNSWRNIAFYDPTADLVVWSAATTHFLELSALYPDFSLGVRDLDLPGLESLLGKASVSEASGTGLGFMLT